MLYSDDLIIFHNSWHALQEQLRILEEVLAQIHLSPSLNKCEAFVLYPSLGWESRSRQPAPPCFNFANGQIQYAENIKYLAFIITEDITFRDYQAHCESKAMAETLHLIEKLDIKSFSTAKSQKH